MGVENQTQALCRSGVFLAGGQLFKHSAGEVELQSSLCVTSTVLTKPSPQPSLHLFILPSWKAPTVPCEHAALWCHDASVSKRLGGYKKQRLIIPYKEESGFFSQG